MDNEVLIKLLQLQFAHNRKIAGFQGKIKLDYFEIDLLEVVLDAVGIPADNTIDQIERYGYSEWLTQPDIVSRSWYYEEFQRRVRLGSYEEGEAYLETIRVIHLPFSSFEPILAEMV
jgi:hypothetical protein